MRIFLWSIVATTSLLSLTPVSVTANYPPPATNKLGDENCEAYAKQGFCQNQAKFMAEFCEKAYHGCILNQAQQQKQQADTSADTGADMDTAEPLTNQLDEPICKQMAKEKKCETQPKIMADFCAKECHERIMSMAYFKSITIDDDEEDQFYDLKAKNWTGSTLHFDAFDGYITSVINIGITCQPEEGEILASKIEQFRKVMPYTLELLIFPFSLTGGDEENAIKQSDCASFDPILKTVRKNVHIMEMTKINGPDAHPVFKFLKKKAEIDNLREDLTSFFFVNPMGTQIDVLEGQTYSKLKQHIDTYLNKWEL